MNRYSLVGILGLAVVLSSGLGAVLPNQAIAQQPAGTKAAPLSEGAKPASLPKCFTTDEKGVVLNPNHDLPYHPYRRVYGFVMTAGGDIYNVYHKGEAATVRAEGSNSMRWGREASEQGVGDPGRCDMKAGESREDFRVRCGANFGNEADRAVRMQHFFSVTLQLDLAAGCPVQGKQVASNQAEASAPAAVAAVPAPAPKPGSLADYWAKIRAGLAYKIEIPGFGASKSK